MIAQDPIFPQQARRLPPAGPPPPAAAGAAAAGARRFAHASPRRSYRTRTVPSPNSASMAANSCGDGLTRYRSESALACFVRS